MKTVALAMKRPGRGRRRGRRPSAHSCAGIRSRRRGRRRTTSRRSAASCRREPASMSARCRRSAPTKRSSMRRACGAAASSRCRISRCARSPAPASSIAFWRGWPAEAGVRQVLVIAGDRDPPAGLAAQRARRDRQRPAAAPRHPRGRHRRLSRRPSAHPGRTSSIARSPTRSRPRRRPGCGCTSSRSSASTPMRSSAGSAGCATSATTRRCGSGSPARPACRR